MRQGLYFQKRSTSYIDCLSTLSEHMEQTQLSWIANFIWGIADDVLRDL
jgi:hypothetical protein